MSQVVDIKGLLEIEQFRLGIGGFYPSRIKRTFLIHLVTIFTYTITFAQLGAVINFALYTTDVSKLSEIFLFSMTQIGFLNKLINFHINSKKIAMLDQQATQEMFIQVNLRELNIWKDALNSCQFVTRVFISSCLGVTILYGAAPLLNNILIGGKNYPFLAKFPFDPDNYYGFIVGGEVLAVGVSAWNNGSMDCLFTKHTAIATTLCAILCQKLTLLLENTQDDHVVHDRIRHCIIYYSEIIKYISTIEDVFSYGIFVQFLCSGIVICLTGFKLLVISEKDSQIGLLLVYLVCMVIQLSLYCWYGHNLMEESNSITKACYIVKWEEINISDRKMLIMIMERAKTPLIMKAMGMFKLNLASLMTILRSSYSFFAVLQQMYKK